MKLIVAGSRTLELYPDQLEVIMEMFPDYSEEAKDPYPLFNCEELISGGCPTGPDRAAKDWSHSKYKEFPADWYKHGKAAGPIRNRLTAEYGDALLLIWDGESRGSKNMKEEMLRLEKPVYEIILKKYNTRTNNV